MATAAERQREFRKRQADNGYVPVTVYVPCRLVGDIQMAARALCENDELELGPLRNVASGRLVKKA